MDYPDWNITLTLKTDSSDRKFVTDVRKITRHFTSY